MANTDYLSLGAAGATVFSDISVSGDIRSSSASASVTTSARVAVQGGAILSSGSLDLRTNTVVVSLDTRSRPNGLAAGQLRLTFQASGISLIYGSGTSYYVIGQSASSQTQQ